MIYIKFDSNNKSIEMRIDPPAVGEESDYLETSNDALFGKRLVKLDNGVREFTQVEYAEEAAAIDREQKAMVIDNMAREMLKQSNELIGPDLYEDLSKDKKAAVKKYREALRDINKQETYPEFVEFPDELIIEEL